MRYSRPAALAALFAVAFAWTPGAVDAARKKDKVPENWPTNPYWTSTPAPRGPGHKVTNFAELIVRSGGKKNIGIKVSVNNPELNIGTFSVGDEMVFKACIGSKNKRFALNHKSGGGAGVENARLSWMDEKGKTVLKTELINGGCG